MKKNTIIFFIILLIFLVFYHFFNFPEIRVAKLDTRVIELSRFKQSLIYKNLNNYEFPENFSEYENSEPLYTGMYYNISYQKENKLYEWVFYGRKITLKIYQGENCNEYSGYDENGKLFNFISDFFE